MAHVNSLREIAPGSVLLANTARAADYLDRYEVTLPPGSQFTTDYLGLQIFESGPIWVDWLMRVRNAVVKPFGLRTGVLPEARADTHGHLNPGDKAGLFTVSHRIVDEIVMAETDRHLDFRASVHQCQSPRGEVRVSVSTAVWFNNVWGRLYFVLIGPFHRLIVSDTLGRMRRRLCASPTRRRSRTCD